MKNSAESVTTRLKNISKSENIDFQLILIRYFHERFLYRLSISDYKNQFLLKGGNLIYALQGLKSRPTKDIDLSGIDIRNDVLQIKRKFVNVCKIEYYNDSVLFDAGSLSAEEITPQDKYQGIRIRLKSILGNVRQHLQIDIGFGDVITPCAITLNYPVLLDKSDVPIIAAYSSETVIAEKFQAMIELAGLNSRMKDYYDVFTLLEDGQYDKAVLKDAIIATFRNRNTHFSENHVLFSDEFTANRKRNVMWKAFLNKTSIKDDLQFDVVISKICTELKPIWLNL